MKAAALLFFTLGACLAQVPNPTQIQKPLTPNETGQPMPIFRVTVVSRTTKAINYHHRTGTTHIDFRGTELMPQARGTASVDSRLGSTKVETHLDHMTPASQFGPEYMTYVLWAITPEGRAMNLGEVALQGDHANLLSTTDLQSFGLIVTAEPYFAVTQPSDVVVAENFVRSDTTGTIEQVDAKFELLQRGQYVLNRAAYQPVRIDPKGPLQLAEAENAVQIARLAGAERYAADTFQKALIDLQNARGLLSRDVKQSETNAREAAQMAEDARIITIKKMREEQLANERSAAAQREAEAKAQAERAAEQARLEQQRRAEAEAQRQAAQEAQRMADEAAAQAAQKQKVLEAKAEEARLNAQKAELARQQAEAEKSQLRERLRAQLNAILETQETARGLIVNISDVLFDFNKYTLKPGAREKMAKVSGILLAYPGLKIQLEGHTDSIGSDEYNLELSQKRADAVRDYLISQGVPMATVSAVGLGKANPVASNDTAAGRQQNRRVEMVVTGDPIGLGGDGR
ncbi:MAG TPA: OmpA family protein [Bryobacteraceae bacterium]|jgi:outer membrane protein OmpA-like peptidoglycan-associated protein|nr:OmpA family protein [Bryobacteraceae bacterium]